MHRVREFSHGIVSIMFEGKFIDLVFHYAKPSCSAFAEAIVSHDRNRPPTSGLSSAQGNN